MTGVNNRGQARAVTQRQLGSPSPVHSPWETLVWFKKSMKLRKNDHSLPVCAMPVSLLLLCFHIFDNVLCRLLLCPPPFVIYCTSVERFLALSSLPCTPAFLFFFLLWPLFVCATSLSPVLSPPHFLPLIFSFVLSVSLVLSPPHSVFFSLPFAQYLPILLYLNLTTDSRTPLPVGTLHHPYLWCNVPIDWVLDRDRVQWRLLKPPQKVKSKNIQPIKGKVNSCKADWKLARKCEKTT